MIACFDSSIALPFVTDADVIGVWGVRAVPGVFASPRLSKSMRRAQCLAPCSTATIRFPGWAARDRAGGGPAARMTLAEFRQLPEQPGLQLIDGLVVKEPSPRYAHQAVIGRLHLEMTPYVDAQGLGRVVLAPCDVVLADDQRLRPDIMFVAAERLHVIEE